jgi:hypothetical protein
VQAVPRVLVGRSRLEVRDDLLDENLGPGEDGILLRREVAEEAALRHPDRPGDVLDGGLVEPALGEERNGRLRDLGPHGPPGAVPQRVGHHRRLLLDISCLDCHLVS